MEPKNRTLSSSSSDLTTFSSTAELIAERAKWGKPIEFVLSCLNYAIGLGNIWRYPYLAFRNGGGAFILPYLLMVFIIGLPIFFAELFIGQFSGLGPIKSYSYIAPIFQGVGYCTLIVIACVTVYYMVIISWIIFYLFSSFSSVLKWGTCDNSWNTDGEFTILFFDEFACHREKLFLACFSTIQDRICHENNSNSPMDMLYWRRKCMDIQTICSHHGLSGVNVTFCVNETSNALVPIRDVISRTLSAEEFFNENVLGLGDATWTNWGYPQWHLILCLAIGWIVAFFCVIKGIQTMGKVVYFTAIFPYVVLIILLIRGVTLDGAIDGILFYITPQWERLASPGVWGDASSQIFYSFGIGCGSLVTLASYNKFKNNCHFDAVFVSMTNFLTAVFAGFVVFAILGFLAKSMNVPIDQVASSGPGLSFITYPEAVLLMPLPQLWAVLFFVMMLILGLGSQFAGIEAINTAIIDHWPHLRNHQWRVTAGTCFGCFIAAIPMTCHGGVYLFTLMEWHTASWAILLIGFAEVVVLSWVYGIDRTLENIAEMGIKLNKFVCGYWKLVWMILTPIGSIGVFIFTLTDIGPTQYGDYLFPPLADTLGWLIGTSTLVPMVYYATKRLIKGKPKGMELLRPTAKWGPQQQTTDAEKNIVNALADVTLPTITGDLK